MPLQIDVEFPDANDIQVSDACRERLHGSLIVRGRGNVVRLGVPYHAVSLYLELGGGCELHVGEQCIFFGQQNIHLLAEGAVVRIGARTAFNGAATITVHEPASVVLGERCYIAGDVLMMASDVHPIFDLETGERLNPPANIELGDRVWVALRATLLRGARLGHDSVVGLGSVVTGQFEPHSLVAGTPARLVRSGIRWEP